MARRKRSSDPSDRLIRSVLTAQLLESADRLAEAEAEVAESKKERDEAILFAKAYGLSLTEIARVARVSRARVQQIAPGRGSPSAREAAREAVLAQISSAMTPTSQSEPRPQ